MRGNTRDPHVTRDDLLDESFREVDFDSQFASPVVDVTRTALPSLYKCLIEAIECKKGTVQKLCRNSILSRVQEKQVHE